MSRRNGEDAFHRLPHPMPRQAPGTAPFVGNASLDDNLAESVQVALWTAIGDDHHQVRIAVADGRVTLSGTLPDTAAAAAATDAVRAVPGVREVVSAIVPARRRRSGATGDEALPYEVMLCTTRYCSLDAPSVRAAVAAGMAALTSFLAARGLPAARDLVLVFRNRRHDTLTVDVCFPVAAATAERAEGDVHVATVPAGPMISAMPGSGVAALLAAATGLEARGAAGATSGWTWQRLPGGAQRPWDAAVPVPINAPAPAVAQQRKGPQS